MREFKTVQSLERGLRMMECAAGQTDGVSLKELALAAGSSEPAAYHMAATLVACGYLRRQENPVRFFPGGKIFLLAQGADGWTQRVESWLVLVRSAMPEAGVYYCAERGQDVCVLLQEYPQMQASNRNSTHSLAAYTSVGSMLHLAFWSKLRQSQYRKCHRFDANGAVIWKTEADLDVELEEIRKDGFFFFPQKDPRHLRLGFPLYDDGGVFRGSFTVSKNLDEATSSAEIKNMKKEMVSLVRRVVGEVK